jgi:hypothetical protein
MVHDLPVLLLSSGDSVDMSHTATIPFVKLPAIILWTIYRAFKKKGVGVGVGVGAEDTHEDHVA